MTETKSINCFLVAALLLCTSSAWAEGALQISGKIKTLKPTTLQVKNLNDSVILNCTISQDGVFGTEKKTIVPDIYKLFLGDTEQKIYLENTPVTINGYFDEKNPAQSSLSFTGIDPFLALQQYMPAEGNPNKAIISPAIKGKLTPGMAAALAYLADVNDYPSNKMLLNMIPIEQRGSLSAHFRPKRRIWSRSK